jgi:hypothetical protein
MRVQLRVEFAGTVMHERGGHEIARRPVRSTALLAHARGGEGFEFAERNAGGFLMRFTNRSSSNVTASTETDLGGAQVKS